jgi:hypothetical protein
MSGSGTNTDCQWALPTSGDWGKPDQCGGADHRRCWTHNSSTLVSDSLTGPRNNSYRRGFLGVIGSIRLRTRKVSHA